MFSSVRLEVVHVNKQKKTREQKNIWHFERDRLCFSGEKDSVCCLFPSLSLSVFERASCAVCVLCLVTQSCLTLCDPIDCSPAASFVHGLLQARTLEWVAFPFSRGSSQLRDWTQVSCIAGGFFTIWATREAQIKKQLGLSRGDIIPDLESSLTWSMEMYFKHWSWMFNVLTASPN